MINRILSMQRLPPVVRRAVERGWRAGVIALWCILVIGFTEVGILLFQQDVVGGFAWVAREFIWTTPLSYLFHLRWVVVIAVFLVTLWSRAPLHYVVVLPLLFVGAFVQLLELQLLHVYAVALMSLGIAFQLARLAGSRSAGFWRLVRRTTPFLAALVVVLAVTLPSIRDLREWRTYATLPTAAAGAPNVLLIILDTVRAKSLSLYGYPRSTTPVLEQWARRGVVFDRAYSTAPWTLPAHASLFTGHYPGGLSVGWLSPLDDEYPTLAEIFRKNGYRTVGISANPKYAGYETGIDRGFGHFEDYKFSWQQVRLSSGLGQVIDVPGVRWIPFQRRYDRKLSEEINAGLLNWMKARNDSRPFFAFLNYFDAHGPYVGRSEFLRQVGGERRKQQDRYDAAIARTDYYLGALYDSLERRGLTENTIIIVTADHGEQFGEHGLIDHGNSLYTPLLHVPLLIVWPERIPRGLRIPETVTLRDVAATVLDLAGVSSRSGVPGSSLSRFWNDGATPVSTPSPVLSMVQQGIRTHPEEPVSRGDMWSLVEGRWHYILNGDGVEELYDLRGPAAEHDLAGTDSLQATLIRLRQAVTDARQRERGRASAESGRDGER